ncbi:acyltransferase family protein [Brachybacterium phenoliresistens]|uniref:Acyltransferase n=1 Tax=Brachybacterium phenoliresistens TaxID=396014 RepID=Z9JP72_9MICO|nr:acyltransferase [Brachybacterium phenoliresistens]EWS79989.1 acyltransferase [Brachybacterium phenoliresistens]
MSASTAAGAQDAAPRDGARPAGMLIGRPFSLQRNGMNLVRLVLATSVLFHHSFPLLGLGEGPVWGVEAIGGWAVIGFFSLSGYLIMASRRTKTFGEYLTLRIARIYPAFLVCLAVTALVFAPISWRRAHGSLEGFWTAPAMPWQYLWNNITLKMTTWNVAGTPLDVPYPGAWNGSLWSLYYEFWCYLVIAVLGILAVARRRAWPVLLLWAASVAFWVLVHRTGRFDMIGFDLQMLGKLLPYFLAGSVLQMLRGRIGMHPLLALAAAAGFIAAVQWDPVIGGQIASLCGTYVLLWISHVLWSPGWVRRHDISYGMYIYAFQVQQLLAVLGFASLGYWRYSLLALAATVPFALASWFLLERPVLRAARRSIAPPAAAAAGTATAGAPTTSGPDRTDESITSPGGS